MRLLGKKAVQRQYNNSQSSGRYRRFLGGKNRMRGSRYRKNYFHPDNQTNAIYESCTSSDDGRVAFPSWRSIARNSPVALKNNAKNGYIAQKGNRIPQSLRKYAILRLKFNSTLNTPNTQGVANERSQLITKRATKFSQN